MTASFNQVEAIMTAAPVIAVITLDRVADAVPLAEALLAGGIRGLEITLRTNAALESIAEAAKAFPEAHVGAGTVLTSAQMEAVAKAGGSFCVSPGATERLLDAAQANQMKLLPGVATATEVMTLLERDVNYLKFFPAEAAGGVAYLKSLSAPIPAAKFCPTGGVKPSNLKDYLSLPNVLCVGGTWVCPTDLMASGDWSAIEALAREAVQMGGV